VNSWAVWPMLVTTNETGVRAATVIVTGSIFIMSVSVTTTRVAGVAVAAGVGAGLGAGVGADLGAGVGAAVGAAARAVGAAVDAGAGVEIRRGPTAHAETRVTVIATSPVARRTFKAGSLSTVVRELGGWWLQPAARARSGALSPSADSVGGS
jgi:hypothetical protein